MPQPPRLPPLQPPADEEEATTGVGADGAASSAAFSAADSPFLTDVGQPFDPDGQPEPEPAPQPAAEGVSIELAWTPQRAELILRGQGTVTHSLIGVGETDWLWQPNELAQAGEAFAAVLNKHPVSRGAAVVSDELALATALLGYAGRSIRERKAVLDAHAAVPEQPVTGRPADPLEPTSPAGPAPAPISIDDVEWRTPES